MSTTFSSTSPALDSPVAREVDGRDRRGEAGASSPALEAKSRAVGAVALTAILASGASMVGRFFGYSWLILMAGAVCGVVAVVAVAVGAVALQAIAGLVSSSHQ